MSSAAALLFAMFSLSPDVPSSGASASTSPIAVAPAGPAPRVRLLRSEPQDERCSIEIEAEGFPAIAPDGSAVALFEQRDMEAADHRGPVLVEWWDRNDAPTRVIPIADASALFRDAAAVSKERCAEATRAAERAVRDINAIVATYRPLDVLPVQTMTNPGLGAPEVEMPQNLHLRPVEVVYKNGRFVGRIRGVKLLQSEVRPSWRGEEPERTLGRTEPAITALYYDAETGLGVAALSYESASCMSDPSIHHAVLPLAPALIEAAHARAHLVRDDDALTAHD